MGFMQEIENEILDNYNESITENGAAGYRTTGKSLLDLNFAVASLRTRGDAEIIKMFNAAFAENEVLALKWLFFARDAREGLGERRLFRVAINDIACDNTEKIKNLIPLIPEYGRWDDLWCLIVNRELKPTVIELIKSTIKNDYKNMKENKPISLIGKWLPSANASSLKTKSLAIEICKSLEMSERCYRKMLSKLRKYIKVVEVKMSAKEWSEIDYEAVPSRANLIYNSAFLRNDEQRRREYLSKLEKGEAKINASVLYPHDIVHRYSTDSSWYTSTKEYDAALESLWKSLPDNVNGCGNTMVVADGSGSMRVNVGTNVNALEVANALAIYFSERSSGEFKNKYITFSSRPQFVDFGTANSLKRKLDIALSHCEVADTNIEAVFNLILDTAVRRNMKQEDLPENVLIISDMEFNSCAIDDKGYRCSNKLFDVIDNRYRNAGYKMPRLVFWNVNSRTNTIPVINNEMGVALVSGFSTNICKMVMSGKTDPYECLLDTLNSKRYQPIEDAIKEC